ncbi:winged helix-turn-helix domain-containing protein [Nocardiopsis sp. CT-R113]|uniref:Winged helix-turn-helix domain-containing protein n=1 Tax=Nocardiopsis codii TaxID=3065942 RepID=A0ABU7K6Y8_9ACTN|nr:winged helix-turn-helix domain-containing protein [Nocardiopsis sp. CT-R113]MEE2038006.1 winged helix-turn-helix domain-containing protein [Nocardiopsis sp. CT-R113]
MLSAHSSLPGVDTRTVPLRSAAPLRGEPSLPAVPRPEDGPLDVTGAAGSLRVPAQTSPGDTDSDHSLLGVLPLPESGKYMLVYGVVVDEPHCRARPLPTTGGALLIDRDARRVWSGGREVELTYQEYELLECLADSPGRAIARGELMERVWGTHQDLHSRTIDVHIHRLRRKLGRAGDLIATVRKVGYIYQGPPTSPHGE